MLNPIIQREMMGALRTRQALVLLCVMALLFSALVVFRWPAGGRADISGSLSQQVFRVFGYGLLATLVLMTPAFPAASIVREKNRGTLTLLMNTPMRPASIYLGKFFGVAGFILVLIAMSLPAAAACYAMGGISFQSGLLALFGILLLVVLEYVALGLLVSSYASSVDSALRMTYGIVLLLAVVSLGPYLFLQGKTGLLADAAGWLRQLSPIPAVMSVLGQADIGSQGLSSGGGRSPVRFSILACVAAAGMAVVTIRRLSYRMLDRPRSQGLITNELTVGEQVVRRLFFIVDPKRRSMNIPRFISPVMVKEFRCRKFGRMNWLVRLVFACMVISLGLTVATTTGTIAWDVKTIGSIMVILQAALIVLLTPALAAGLISTERESGGWQLLQMTPLSAVRIVVGKMFSVVWPVSLLLCATLPGYAVMYAIDKKYLPQIQEVMGCLVVTSVFAICSTAAISSVFRRTATATTVAYAVLVGILAGTMLVWVARGAPFGHTTVETVLTFNPVAAALAANDTSGFQDYELLPISRWISLTASGICLLVLGAQTWRLTRPQ